MLFYLFGYKACCSVLVYLLPSDCLHLLYFPYLFVLLLFHNKYAIPPDLFPLFGVSLAGTLPNFLEGFWDEDIREALPVAGFDVPGSFIDESVNCDD